MGFQEIASYGSYFPFLLIFPLAPRTVHRWVMVIISDVDSLLLTGVGPGQRDCEDVAIE